MTESTALTTRQQPSAALQVFGKVDNPIAFSKEMADAYASFMGVGMAQGKALALAGLCQRLDPTQFPLVWHYVQGRLTKRADRMLTEFRESHGGSYTIEENTEARAAAKYTDNHGNTYDREFTRKQALLSRWPWQKDNGGWKAHVPKCRELFSQNKSEEEVWLQMSPHFKDNWGTETDWQDMLWNRMVSGSLKKICPELAAGIYTPEEIEDAVDVEFTKTEPLTAEEFFAAQQQQAGQAPQPPAEAEAVEAEFTPADPAAEAPHEHQRLIDGIRDLVERLAGEESPKVIESILSKRNVNSFRSLDHEQLVDIRNRLEAKEAAKANAAKNS